MFHNYHKSAELSASKWLNRVWELAVPPHLGAGHANGVSPASDGAK